MSTAAVFTDIETALVTWINAASGIALTCSTRLPRAFEDADYFTLRRSPGGTWVDAHSRHLEAGRLQLDSYATTDVAAFAAMARGVERLVDVEGETIAGVVFTSVQVPQSPQWLPDPETEQPRYLAFAIVHAHPAPA